MSPLPLVSAGMGMTLSTSSLSVGNAAGGGLKTADMGTISVGAEPILVGTWGFARRLARKKTTLASAGSVKTTTTGIVPHAPPWRNRPPHPWHARAPPVRLGHAEAASPLSVAIQVARGGGVCVHGGREAGQRQRAAAAQGTGGRDGVQAWCPRRAAGGAGGLAGGVRGAAPVHLVVHRAARAGVCQGYAGCSV